MVRTAELGLIGGVALAALAFGGTEAPYLPLVQIVLLGLSIVLLLSYRTANASKLRVPVAVPLLLVALVLLQMAPFPASLLQLFDRTRSGFGDGSLASISIAPYETLSGFVTLLTYVAAFYLAVVACQRRDTSRHLVFTLLALGTFEACYGLVQYLAGSQQIFTYVNKHASEAATGTYVNYDHYAGLLEMILPFSLALAYYQFEKIPQPQSGIAERIRSFFTHEESHKFLLWLFLAMILGAALVFSRSRMGILSALISALLLFIVVATSGWRRTNATLVALLFVSAAIAVVVWIGPEPVIGRFQELGQEYAAGGQNRLAIWRDTLVLIGQHPFLGRGLGTFFVAYPSVQTAFLNNLVSHAHNDYLEFASELGLPGAFLLFGAAFSLLLQSVRRFRDGDPGFERAMTLGAFGGLAAILLHSLADFNLHIPANGLLFAVLLGLAYAGTHNHEPQLNPETN